MFAEPGKCDLIAFDTIVVMNWMWEPLTLKGLEKQTFFHICISCFVWVDLRGTGWDSDEHMMTSYSVAPYTGDGNGLP